MLVFPSGRKLMGMILFFRWYSFGNNLLEGNIKSWAQGFGQKRQPNSQFHRKTSSFRSLNNLVEKWKYTDRFSSSRWVLHHFSVSKTASYWKRYGPKQLGYTRFVSSLDIFSSHFPIVFFDPVIITVEHIPKRTYMTWISLIDSTNIKNVPISY